MSAEFPSSNPFRRKAPPSTITSTYPESPSIPSPAQISYQHPDPPLRSPTVQVIEAPKKITKKVRVQSPPPPSPSVPDSASTVGEHSFLGSYKPSNEPELQQDGEDPFGSVTSDTSEDEAVENIRKVPANPFSRTLETMEHPVRGGQGHVVPSVTSPGRASLDVDAFKRLLMTGNAGLGLPTSPPPNPAHAVRVGDTGSGSTDTSSISRQSIFEAIPETHLESPRTSHELDDEARELITESHSSTAGRKKPPPPSSKHGRLLRLELRDDPPSNSTNISSPTTPSSASLQFNPPPIRQTPSQTDLNKPLPPAPRRASHDSDHESIFDKESAGKTPEPPSPSASIRKKTPPAPPITRRRSQLVSDSKLSRSNSGRLSPKVEEEERATFESIESGRPRSGSGRGPPPPPRRPASIRASSHHLSSSPSSSTVSLPTTAPIPPPTRGASTRKSASGRPPSVRSLESQTNSKRASVVPPPPPPRARNNPDAQSIGNSRVDGGLTSRSIENIRRESTSSHTEAVEDKAGGHDILADLTALQREIDALRNQSEKDKIT